MTLYSCSVVSAWFFGIEFAYRRIPAEMVLIHNIKPVIHNTRCWA